MLWVYVKAYAIRSYRGNFTFGRGGLHMPFYLMSHLNNEPNHV